MGQSHNAGPNGGAGKCAHSNGGFAMTQGPSTELRVIQIGANTSDLPGSLRLFAEAFGFRNGGANGLWGPVIGAQGLPHDSRAIMWWLIGAQSFFQLEMFHHTQPAQRPKRKDWRPSDHGWVRFGVATADFDSCLRTLALNGVTTITPPIMESGLRRVAFLEPYLKTVVEVLEKEKTGIAGLDGPSVVYAASSVSDIESARRFYRDVLTLKIDDDNALHTPAHEYLWGLKDARRQTFTARGAGDIAIEIVQYSDPTGRPRSADYRASDQGIVNVCLGSRDADLTERAMGRAIAAGFKPPVIFKGGGFFCGYLLDPEREIELTAVPEHRDAESGFAPNHPWPTA
jgi:catechol 2,3-dioxygenase-like lactoylglutathione lyase family enzyme